jgi:hypothetical protein
LENRKFNRTVTTAGQDWIYFRRLERPPLSGRPSSTIDTKALLTPQNVKFVIFVKGNVLFLNILRERRFSDPSMTSTAETNGSVRCCQYKSKIVQVLGDEMMATHIKGVR